MDKELKTLKIDQEFENLIPRLTDEEYELLHASIDQDGCIDPIIVWGDCIVDGHNRYHICRLLKISFTTSSIEFQSRDEAKTWILRHQLGKRNVTDAQRIEVALKLKPLIAERAKANQSAGGGAVPIKISNPIDTREEIAKMAGVSPAQVSKVEQILNEGDDEDRSRLRSGESINSVHNAVKTKMENLENKVILITKKQVDRLLKEVCTKIEKISLASEDIVCICETELRNIASKLTEILERKKEKVIHMDEQTAFQG